MSCGWAVQLLRGAAFLFMTHEVHSSQPAGIPQRNAAKEATTHHGRKPWEWRFVGPRTCVGRRGRCGHPGLA
ncbi:hypothetical protein SETIT_7G202400v2 [Setaria italica]|uniref:Secreted protein n=2 Tax=Setaria TaxID=4554 RepID=A0A368RXW2_SETIT|nr:hypothetical protein SETIT_7G202400v2 [Setaria italica]TKW06013.1 hypothetical protein SEVIR_7G214200v2 [Setaria viridis]